LILADAEAIHRLVSRREIADTTLEIPHPCSRTQVEGWIYNQARAFLEEDGIGFGVELKQSHELIGAVILHSIHSGHSQAEMGFWMGVNWWNQGYCTEAGELVLRFGFEQRGLNRICAYHMVRNPGAGRVLEKLGMRREGLLRQRVRKAGVYEDVLLWAALRSDRVTAIRNEEPGRGAFSPALKCMPECLPESISGGANPPARSVYAA
jgi:RimJ/RimL family protein N-acetyltransferase